MDTTITVSSQVLDLETLRGWAQTIATDLDSTASEVTLGQCVAVLADEVLTLRRAQHPTRWRRRRSDR